MKLIFRPIFIIFFIFLSLSFALSMNRSRQQSQKNRESLLAVTTKNQQLQLKKEELELAAQLANQPLVQEQLLRDQKWLKLANEQNLELTNFVYEPRQLPVTVDQTIDYAAAWRDLLL